VNVLAGFSLGKADLLRRAISKKKEDVMQEVRADFLKGATQKGVDSRIAEKVFNLIEYFAGYGFNKSHSAAYAMISYRTAYLKANFTVEFMTALLTSEKDNTDKIVLYIDEAKRMGLKVLPPDVNESFPQFTVVGTDMIRFGLAAVKNVGQTAIDAIIQGRIKRDRFKSFFDLIENCDLRVVNRKVLESLIKCGAFDSMGLKRSQLYDMLDGALSRAGEVQKDRVSGQISFFDSLEHSAVFEKNAQTVPDIPEWPESVILANEKEMLGFYVTGHPLQRVKAELRSYTSASSSVLVERRDGEEVTIGGLVNKLKFTQTKKNNEKMAIVTMEDLQGSVDLLVFPRAFKDFGHHLTKDAILIFRGNVDKKEQNPKILVNEIHTVSEMHKKAKTVVLKIEVNAETEGKIKSLQEILAKFKGPSAVYIEFYSNGRMSQRILVDKDKFVQPGEEMSAALQDMLGADCVRFRV